MKELTKERREVERFIKENNLVSGNVTRRNIKKIALEVIKIGSGSFWGGNTESSESYLVKHNLLDYNYGVIRINWFKAYWVKGVTAAYKNKRYILECNGIVLRVCVR